MKEPLQQLLSEVGESFDYLRSDVRNLGRYVAKLEDLLEHYRSFVSQVTFSTPTDLAEMRKLLKRTQKIIGPPPGKSEDATGTDDREAEKAAPLDETQVGDSEQAGKV